jgi:phage terminase small subunit
VALSAKQRLFAEEYLVDFNATQAAKRAGYSERRANRTGHRLVHLPEVEAYIRARIEAVAMTADEVLIRLAQQARGEATAYLYQGVVEDEETGQKLLPMLDLEGMRKDGRLHLVKKVSEYKGRTEIEFYDAQSALQLIGKHLGMFRDKVEHSGADGGPIDMRDVSEKDDGTLTPEFLADVLVELARAGAIDGGAAAATGAEEPLHPPPPDDETGGVPGAD